MFERRLPRSAVATLTTVRVRSPGVATGLTLAFDLAALRGLSDPAAALADARGWSEQVGIVSDQPPYVLTKFTREHGLRNDFPPEPAPAAETLDHMHTHHDTERYVYVVPDGATITAGGWELLPLPEAAERAEWELGEPADGESGTDQSPGEEEPDWP